MVTSPASEHPWRGLLVRRGFERRSVVLLAAAVLLAAIFAAMRLVSDPAPGIGTLAVFPVTLIALELGLEGALASAALSVIVLAVNAAGGHPELGVVGVVTRGLVFMSVGAVTGRFSDRMRRAYAREERLLRSGLEVGGSLGNGHLPDVVARAAARLPGVRGVRVAIDGIEPAEAGRRGGVTASLPIAVRGRRLGHIEIDGELGDEDRAALELLAAQAALAADNLRLLERERERAGIEAELLRVRDELTEHRSGLGQLLSSQEDERSRIAQRLHEDLAQILSAVLMGLRVLDREAPDRRAAAVEDLRGPIADVLRELREVAGSLRPASLAQLGLRPALEALAAGDGLDLDLDDTGALPAPVETAVYRIVQDALAACREDGRLAVRLASDTGSAALDLRLPAPACRQALLPAVRARTEALAGHVTVPEDDARRVVVTLPLVARTLDGRPTRATGPAGARATG